MKTKPAGAKTIIKYSQDLFYGCTIQASAVKVGQAWDEL
jgi:hypothetical protein